MTLTASGSELDFDAFFEANVERVQRLAWRLLGGDEASADDVVQTTFAKAHRYLPRFRGEARPETWLYRIVISEAASLRRKRRVRAAWRGLFGGDEGAYRAALEPTPAAGPGDPGLRRRILEALEELSPQQREVFVLIHLEGQTVRETAALLGRTDGTIKTHLHRALASLRETLADLKEEVTL